MLLVSGWASGQRELCWAAFFSAILCAWAALFVLAAAHVARAPAELLGPGMGLLAPILSLGAAGTETWSALEAICFAGPRVSETPLPVVLAMWALMALAMMAPTATPLLAAYGDLAAGNPTRIQVTGFWALLGGFCLVWLAFAAVVGLLHGALARAELLSAGGLVTSPWLAAALTAASGLYQLSSLKAACLARCRSPLGFLLSHWRDGSAGALRMGIRSGLDCLGCCWALMLLAFVGGTMNLVWMGLAMLLMTVEKLPALGRVVTRPLGIALLVLAAALGARAVLL